MPLVTGETLRARMERERQLHIADAVRTAREVASALDYAHRQNVIHRDIKPENILLQDGSAVVADFGIALVVQAAGGQRMTQTGLSLGTPQYMSPAQATGERTIDARSDVYALAAVTYEMLAGEPPFTGPTVQAIVAGLMSEAPRALATQRPAVPPHVEAAVLQRHEKIPADRFASEAEFAETMRGCTGARRDHAGHRRCAADRLPSECGDGQRMIDVNSRLTAARSDRYRVGRELGQSGMATVYLAHDLEHDRDITIKMPHPDLGAAVGGERFLSEIRTTARMQQCIFCRCSTAVRRMGCCIR